MHEPAPFLAKVSPLQGMLSSCFTEGCPWAVERSLRWPQEHFSVSGEEKPVSAFSRNSLANSYLTSSLKGPQTTSSPLPPQPALKASNTVHDPGDVPEGQLEILLMSDTADGDLEKMKDTIGTEDVNREASSKCKGKDLQRILSARRLTSVQLEGRTVKERQNFGQSTQFNQ
ncbi:hypothetical protein JZ751_013565, partial [Albula glossodonta]